VDDPKYRQARSTPSSVPSTVTKCHSNCICDDINDDNKESVNRLFFGGERQTEGRVKLYVRMTC
jgi:hypothetical protein